MDYDNNLVTGVMDLEVTINSNGSTPGQVQSAALSALVPLFPDVPNPFFKFDNIMLCLPFGSHIINSNGEQSLNWVAYASVGGSISVYNGDEWCANEVTQVHEIGHNWGLR